MKKLIITILVSISIFSSYQARSEVLIDMYLGLSGTTSFFWALDEVFDTNGEFMQMAGQLGFLTGELGFALKAEGSVFGVAFEGNFGYYHHYDTAAALLSYTMFHGGIEPYVKIDSFALGLGLGYFVGFMFMDYDVYTIRDAVLHHGISAWVSGEYEFDDYFVMSARFRYHHFFGIGYLDLSEPELKSMADDFVFSLRFIFRLRLDHKL